MIMVVCKTNLKHVFSCTKHVSQIENLVFMVLIDYMDMVLFSVIQKQLVSTTFLFQQKQTNKQTNKKWCEDRGRGIFRKIKNTRHRL